MFFKEDNRRLFFFNIFFSQHIMTESLIFEEGNLIKDIRNIFELKKELNYTAIKDIRSLFRLKKETKAIKERVLRDIKIEHEEEEN